MFRVLQSCLLASLFGLIHLEQQDCSLVQLDLVLVIDSSASVGSKNFKKMINFFRDVIQHLPVQEDGIRVGLVRYSKKAEVVSFLNVHMKKEEKISAIRNMKFRPGSTATHQALNLTRNLVLTSEHGDRGQVPDLVIVTTDGASDNPKLTSIEVMALKNRLDIKVVVIGIGEFENEDELYRMASAPHMLHRVTSFDKLVDIMENVATLACSDIKHSTNLEIPTKPMPAQLVSAVTLQERNSTFPIIDRSPVDHKSSVLSQSRLDSPEMLFSPTFWSQFSPSLASFTLATSLPMSTQTLSTSSVLAQFSASFSLANSLPMSKQTMLHSSSTISALPQLQLLTSQPASTAHVWGHVTTKAESALSRNSKDVISDDAVDMLSNINPLSTNLAASLKFDSNVVESSPFDLNTLDNSIDRSSVDLHGKGSAEDVSFSFYLSSRNRVDSSPDLLSKYTLSFLIRPKSEMTNFPTGITSTMQISSLSDSAPYATNVASSMVTPALKPIFIEPTLVNPSNQQSKLPGFSSRVTYAPLNDEESMTSRDQSNESSDLSSRDLYIFVAVGTSGTVVLSATTTCLVLLCRRRKSQGSHQN